MNSIPAARGLILCDAVRPDSRTDNLTLVNCFNRLTAPVFPCSNRAFCVAAFLADGFGELLARVELEELESGRVIYHREHRLTLPDRLYEMRYRFQVTGCIFPRAGVYEARLLVERELVADTRFELTLRESTNG